MGDFRTLLCGCYGLLTLPSCYSAATQLLGLLGVLSGCYGILGSCLAVAIWFWVVAGATMYGQGISIWLLRLSEQLQACWYKVTRVFWMVVKPLLCCSGWLAWRRCHIFFQFNCSPGKNYHFACFKASNHTNLRVSVWMNGTDVWFYYTHTEAHVMVTVFSDSNHYYENIIFKEYLEWEM